MTGTLEREKTVTKSSKLNTIKVSNLKKINSVDGLSLSYTDDDDDDDNDQFTKTSYNINKNRSINRCK